MNIKMLALSGLVALSAQAQNDYSNCFDTESQVYSDELQVDGFAYAGSSRYQVQTHRFGGNAYWKDVSAHRYENRAGAVAYSTCLGVRNHGLFRGQQFFNGELVFVDHRIEPVMGDDQLIFNVFAQGGWRQLVLIRSGESVWTDMQLNGMGGMRESLRIRMHAGGFISGMAKFEMGHWVSYGDLEYRPGGIRTLTIVDEGHAESIRVLDATREFFAQGESGLMRIVNASSFNVTMTGATATAFLRPHGDVLFAFVGVPSDLRFEPYPGESLRFPLRRSGQGPN